MAMKCAWCGGTGVIYDEKKGESYYCPNCGGSGLARDTVKRGD